MNMVSSNTKYVVKMKKFNVIGTLLSSSKSASESNHKANIKAGGGGLLPKDAFKVIGSVLEAIF